MSILSKMLGLDKPRNKPILDKINAVGKDAIDLATRAMTTSVQQLVADKDFDAFKLRMQTELTTIEKAETSAIKDTLIKMLKDELA